MILLGYDGLNQVAVARYQGTTIICGDSDRATEIINGLYEVAEEAGPLWLKAVQYSDQAWNDLLSIGVVLKIGKVE